MKLKPLPSASIYMLTILLYAIHSETFQETWLAFWRSSSHSEYQRLWLSDHVCLSHITTEQSSTRVQDYLQPSHILSHMNEHRAHQFSLVHVFSPIIVTIHQTIQVASGQPSRLISFKLSVSKLSVLAFKLLFLYYSSGWHISVRVNLE
jgi:hypothetical protein